jgi:hypothetical protein
VESRRNVVQTVMESRRNVVQTVMESRRNVVQTVMEATKHPDNPLLPLGDLHEWDALQARPWETKTVIYDEEERLFKCWYSGTDLSTDRWWATGYAISEDGITWIKPKLGLHEYNGNTDNNICLRAWGPVLKDAAEPDPARRYKIFLKGPTRAEPVRVAYSPDGIHWTEGARIDLPVWEGRFPDQVALFRDEQDPDPQRRYKSIWQIGALYRATKPGPETARAKFLSYGPDVEHLRASDRNPIIGPNEGLEQEIHFVQITPWLGQYVMLYEYGWYVPNGTGIFGQYAADIRLAFGRDAESFQRVQPSLPVIPRGRRGEWDSQFLIISNTAVIKGDTIYLYYAGNGEEWSQWPGGNQNPAFAYASSGAVRVSRMGLATLRLDGWACLQTGDRETPGYAVTAPVKLAQHNLQLLTNTSDNQQNRSWLEVEVLDAATDDVLPGFGREDALPIWRNGVRVPVAWRGAQFGSLAGRHIKLRFWLIGASRLYAFSFRE